MKSAKTVKVQGYILAKPQVLLIEAQKTVQTPEKDAQKILDLLISSLPFDTLQLIAIKIKKIQYMQSTQIPQKKNAA